MFLVWFFSLFPIKRPREKNVHETILIIVISHSESFKVPPSFPQTWKAQFCCLCVCLRAFVSLIRCSNSTLCLVQVHLLYMCVCVLESTLMKWRKKVFRFDERNRKSNEIFNLMSTRTSDDSSGEFQQQKTSFNWRFVQSV